MQKRPQSAFFLYANEVRASVRAENPGLKMPAIMSLLAERWHSMDDDAKVVRRAPRGRRVPRRAHPRRQKYNELAAKEKARFQKEMESYTPVRMRAPRGRPRPA